MRRRFNGVMSVTYAIIAICVAVFLWQLSDPTSMRFALTGQALLDGDYVTLLTSMFMHGGIVHILSNMLSLWYLAKALRGVLSGRSFFLAYMVSGIVGGLFWAFCAVQNGNLTGSCVGASGAIFGILGVYGTVLLKMKKTSDVSVPLRSWLYVLGLNLFIGLTDSGIALEGHIGGFVAGLVIGAIMMSKRDMSMYRMN